jgi:hypothetical protein
LHAHICPSSLPPFCRCISQLCAGEIAGLTAALAEEALPVLFRCSISQHRIITRSVAPVLVALARYNYP